MKLSTYEITITVTKVLDMNTDLSAELETEVRLAIGDKLLGWGKETITARKVDTRYEEDYE